MADVTAPRPPIDQYPRAIVLTRWLLLAIEASIAVYLIINIRIELAVLYVAYGVISLFMFLPLIRCVRCSYYGKRCNFGWGSWVAKVFPKDESRSQSAYYGWTFLFWPLRLIPLLLSFKLFLSGVVGLIADFSHYEFAMSHGLFLIYMAVLLVHRKFYRAASCSRCHERACCPVYNSRAILAGTPGGTSGIADKISL